jgi:nitrogen regulatory protein P-II 1
MKTIKAIIQPHMVSKVVRALHELPHFPGLTIADARGQGRGRGAGGAFQVTEDSLDYHPTTVLEILCTDELTASITETIQRVAHTGHAGDGVITVTELAEVIRIRTGEKQQHAV